MRGHRRVIGIGDLTVMPGAFRHLGAAIFNALFVKKRFHADGKGVVSQILIAPHFIATGRGELSCGED